MLLPPNLEKQPPKSLCKAISQADKGIDILLKPREMPGEEVLLL